MQDIKLNRINNIFLGVSDLGRSSAFYRETLGLDLQFEMEGFVFLKAGGVALALSTAHAGLATPLAGATEVVFGVDDVTATHEALTARGVEFLHPPRNVTGDQWAANFRDPDGHVLSIFGPQKA
ncbi:MAG: VOC family protein [Acidobacteria bacterium]|nr:VOC family protein [Acidobacteriota bacterium]